MAEIFHRQYYTPMRQHQNQPVCAVVVMCPIATGALEVLKSWFCSDKRRQYSLLFLGEKPVFSPKTELELFTCGIDYNHMWDENTVRLGLQLRYRLAHFSHVLFDDKCPNDLLTIIYDGFGISAGTTFRINDQHVIFGRWDINANASFFLNKQNACPQNTSDTWYKALNSAIIDAKVWTTPVSRHAPFPDWLDAWADSYADFVHKEGNVPASLLSSIAHELSNAESNAKNWPMRVELMRLLTLFISRLKRHAELHHYNLDWSEDNLVTSIFHKGRLTSQNQQFNYAQGHVVCAIRFMQWLIHELVEGNNVYGLIVNLVTDLYGMNQAILKGSLRELYDGHQFGRCGIPLTRYDHYRDAYRVAIYQGAPVWRTTSEVMGTAGLRQALETGFNRIIGLLWTDSHIFHDLIPSALRDCRDIKYPNSANKSPLEKVMLIYAWSNTAVHKAQSDTVWTVWEAFEYCSVLFKPANAQKFGKYNIDSSVCMSMKSLYAVRRAVVNGLCQWATKARANSVCIQWGKPAAVIVDMDAAKRNWDICENCGVRQHT